MRIEELFQKDNEKVFVVGEIAGAHDGKMDRMKKLIQIAADAKVDAVKFQLFRADQLVTRDHPKHPGFTEKEYSHEEWKEITDFAKSIGLTVFADVFDKESLDIAKDCGIQAFKLHSTIISDVILVRNIAETQKPIMLAVGGSTYDEIQGALKIFKEVGNDVVLIAGYQNFPTKLEDSNLNIIPYLQSEFNLPVGYADHCDAHTDMALHLPLMAVAKGARLIEKHFTINRSLKQTDYFSSLNPDELQKLVCLLKESEKTFGKSSLETFSDEEEEYRNKMKKFIVAARDINKGATLSLGMLAFKRTTKTGIFPKEYSKLVDKVVNRDLKRDEIVMFEDLS